MEYYIDVVQKVETKVRNFSDLSIGSDPISGFILCNDLSPHFYVWITVYRNGKNTSDEGYVSVEISEMHNSNWGKIRDVRLNLVLSVLDAEGNSRFPQSFQIFSEAWVLKTVFNIEGYISRSVLLNEPTELLPNDTLTLQMDIVIRFTSDSLKLEEVKFSNNFLGLKLTTEGGRSLDLDSAGVNRLALESRYFRRILETPMREQNSRKVIIPDEEYNSFRLIGEILVGVGVFRMDTLGEILDLYATAEKYDIPTVLDTCRRWLQLCLTSANVSEISEFAHSYSDDRLIETVETFQRSEDGAIGKSPTDLDEEWTFDGGGTPLIDARYYRFVKHLLSDKPKNENNEIDKSGSDVFNIYI